MLPRVGELVALRLPDGYWGACFVARRGKPNLGVEHLGEHVIVAALDWFGEKPPQPRDVAGRGVLHIDHEGYDLAAIFHVNEPTEAVVGKLAKRPRVGPAPWVAGWPRIAFLLDRQRAWNVDRAASAAAYEKQKVAWAEQHARDAARAAAERARRESSLTLAKLRRARSLPSWRGAMPAERLREARALLADLFDALEGATAKKKLAGLRACVLAFNEWNDVHGVIETAEREALHELLCTIARVAGLGDRGEAIDEWRDW